MLLQHVTGDFLKADGTLTDNEYEAKRYPFKEVMEMSFNKKIPKGFNVVCDLEEYI